MQGVLLLVITRTRITVIRIKRYVIILVLLVNNRYTICTSKRGMNMQKLINYVTIAVVLCTASVYAQDEWELQIVGTSITVGQAQTVANSGTYAFIADAENGVSVFDISNPVFPVSVGLFDNGGIVGDLIIENTNAYLAHWGRGLTVLDISNPAEPESIGAYNTAGSIIDIYKIDNYIYAADFFNGLVILDISNLDSIYQAGFAAQIGVISVAAIDSVIYSGVQSMGLVTYSLADILNPVVMDTDAISTDCNDIVIYENYLLLACGQAGMLVYDITDRLNPDSVTAINTEGSLNRISVRDTIAYLADGENGLVAVNISDPENLNIIQTMDTPGIASGVGFSPDFVLVADRGLLLVVYHEDFVDIEDDNKSLPSKMSLNSCYPNPFNPSTMISFELQETSYITLNIYDIQGRFVEKLIDGNYDTGNYSFKWNASSKPSGMYFIGLSCNGHIYSTKALYLK